MSDTQTTTIDNDVDERDDDLGPLTETGAEDAFLRNIGGADEATDQSDTEGTEADAETGASDDSETGDDESPTDATENSDAPTAQPGDDAIVEVKVGEETHKVAVKDLKRLFGQEAALTRRSQEVAEARTRLQQEAERTSVVLQKALERAQAKAKPYAEMDFWKLSKQLDSETFEQIRKDAKDALDEVSFLETEMRTAQETSQRAAQEARATAAQACVQALTTKDSPHHIPDWSPKVYGDLLEFATAQGFDARNVVDPAAIKLLRMAMLYQRGQTIVREKVKKAVTQPTTPMRPGSAGAASPARRTADAAVTRLRKSGSAQDAEAAFMSRLRPRDDD